MAGCRSLSDDEVELVRTSFKGHYALRNRCLWEVGTKTGFRISELLSLKIHDVIQHGQIKDAITVSARFMKGKTKSRSVVLHNSAKEAISDYLNGYEKKWGYKPAPDLYHLKSQ